MSLLGMRSVMTMDKLNGANILSFGEVGSSACNRAMISGSQSQRRRSSSDKKLINYCIISQLSSPGRVCNFSEMQQQQLVMNRTTYALEILTGSRIIDEIKFHRNWFTLSWSEGVAHATVIVVEDVFLLLCSPLNFVWFMKFNFICRGLWFDSSWRTVASPMAVSCQKKKRNLKVKFKQNFYCAI